MPPRISVVWRDVHWESPRLAWSGSPWIPTVPQLRVANGVLLTRTTHHGAGNDEYMYRLSHMKRVAAFMCWQGDTDATRWSTGLSSDLLVPSHRDCDSGSDIAASGGASYLHHFLVKLVLRLEGSGLTTSTPAASVYLLGLSSKWWICFQLALRPPAW